jgi:hypothetical protein
MIYKEDSVELDLDIKADPRYAQILIEITDSPMSDKEAS